MSSEYDYGKDGFIGIATPQANPTVESELSILLPRSVSIQASRLVCLDSDPLVRLVHYIENLEQTVLSYAGMKLDAIGFACTGSAYLVGAKSEQEMVDRILVRSNYKLVTATAAIKAVLDAKSISRVALIAPYPQYLIDAGVKYWEELGIEITAVCRVETADIDTRSIYQLCSDDAAKSLAKFEHGDAQAILLSGTGMPTLPLIADNNLDIPVLSSNFCLAFQLLANASITKHLDLEAIDIKGWRARLAETGALNQV